VHLSIPGGQGSRAECTQRTHLIHILRLCVCERNFLKKALASSQIFRASYESWRAACNAGGIPIRSRRLTPCMGRSRLHNSAPLRWKNIERDPLTPRTQKKTQSNVRCGKSAIPCPVLLLCLYVMRVPRSPLFQKYFNFSNILVQQTLQKTVFSKFRVHCVGKLNIDIVKNMKVV
jgi:hypothetical protein